MEEKNFESLKEEILKRAKKAKACTEGYRSGYEAKNLSQLMKVLRKNFVWACCEKVINSDIIKRYEEEFSDGDIYCNQDINSGCLLVDECNNVCVRGNSLVVAIDNASVCAYEYVNVWAYGHSTIDALSFSSVNAHDNTSVRSDDFSSVKAFDDTMVHSYGRSHVLAFDNVKVEARDHSVVKRYGDSVVKAFDEAYITTWENKNTTIKDYAVLRLFETRKIIGNCISEKC